MTGEQGTTVPAGNPVGSRPLSVEKGTGAGSDARAGFLLDLDRCVGCGACVVACRNENRLGPTLQWRRLATFNPRRDLRLPTWHLSLACHHCRRAPCVRACPSGALEQRADGVVWLDRKACLGCRYCEMACPFGAPAYDEGAGVMTKCHLCLPRIDEGRQPACVAACPTEALLSASAFEEIPSRFSRAVSVPGFRDPVAAYPSFWLALPTRGRRGAAAGQWEGAWSAPPEKADGLGPPEPRPSASSFHEVPLVVFSALAVLGAGLGGSPLVRWVFGGNSGGSQVLWGGLSPGTAVATALGLAVGLLVSLGHLGQPRRAWLALRGLGRSALSTEVAILGGALLSSAAAALWSGEGFVGTLVGLLAPPMCLLTLVALGWVYRFEHQYAWRGWATWQPLVQGGLWGWVAAALFPTVLASDPPQPVAVPTVADTLPFWMLLALDGLVFLGRGAGWRDGAGPGSPAHPQFWARRRAMWATRFLFGTLLPAAVALGGRWGWVLVFLTVAVGVERLAFYALARRWTHESELVRLESLAVPGKASRADLVLEGSAGAGGR